MKMIEKIDQLLTARNMSQATLEQLVGLSQNRITKWKAGQGEPTARQAYRIAEVFGVSVGWLISDEDHDKPVVADGLNEDERAVLDVYRALKLDRHEAIRRLAGAIRSSATHEAAIASAFSSENQIPTYMLLGAGLVNVTGLTDDQVVALAEADKSHRHAGVAADPRISTTLAVRDMTESVLARDRERKAQERERQKKGRQEKKAKSEP